MLTSCESIGLGKYCLGDARSLIKEIEDNSVDAIVTDPPWGVKKGRIRRWRGII